MTIRDPASDRVLVLDSVEADGRRAAEWLEVRGLSVEIAADLHKPVLSRYGLIILDMDLLQGEWSRHLSRVKQSAPETEFILTTQAGEGSVEAAVSAMREGAFDYLVKPLDPNRLPVLVHKALERRRLSEENRSLRQRLSLKDEYGNVVGKSRLITEVYEIASQVADTSATALLTGDSGMGKELVAKAIHKRSRRKDHPFVSINCGALPEGLLESELFGFERGAFTGAIDAKPGRFELADGGTLFLDEVGEMSAKTQVEFLRVLQEREFRRLGGDKLVRVDVRIIAATNKDLLQDVGAGRFRQDLYYRLAVVPIHLPSLRERREDIPLLVDAFLQEFARMSGKPAKRFSRDAMEALSHYERHREAHRHGICGHDPPGAPASGNGARGRCRTADFHAARDAAAQSRRDRDPAYARRAHRSPAKGREYSRHQSSGAALQNRPLRVSPQARGGGPWKAVNRGKS